MSVIKSYLQGLSASSRRPRLVALLWLWNLVFALPAFFGLKTALGRTLGQSLAADRLLETMDPEIIFEFLTASGGGLAGLRTTLLVIVGLHVLAYPFAFGGILGVLAPEARGEKTGRVFFAAGGRFYGRFLRLAVYSSALWVPALAVFGVANAVLRAATSNPAQEGLRLAAALGRVLVFLFLAYVIEMILDYARIKIAAGDSRQVFRSLVGAARFVLSRPLGTLGLYYLLGLTGWALFGVYLVVQSGFAKTTSPGVIAGFLVTQAFIAGRGWLRTAYLAAQRHYLESSPPA